MERLKNFRSALALLLTLLVLRPMQSQTDVLAQYRWKNRLFLIFDDTAHAKLAQEQITLMRPLDDDFKDRKLLVFLITNKGYKILNKEEIRAQDSPLMEGIRTDTSMFRIQLMGLDGGVKLNRSQTITREELFRRIDAMPMRKTELRQKN